VSGYELFERPLYVYFQSVPHFGLIKL